MELQAEKETSSSSKEKSEENPYRASVEHLSNGFVNTYEPPLKEVKTHLNELLYEQSDLLKKIHVENLNLSEVQHSAELQEMFDKVKTYSAKLHGIKKDMKVLHERSTKLKKRSEKLQNLCLKQSTTENKEGPIK